MFLAAESAKGRRWVISTENSTDTDILNFIVVVMVSYELGRNTIGLIAGITFDSPVMITNHCRPRDLYSYLAMTRLPHILAAPLLRVDGV